jgi:hypothetical protein
MARHTELRVDLEEKLAPEKRGEVSSENAQRMIALACSGSMKKQGVDSPGIREAEGEEP